MVIQLGVVPRPIDILCMIDGVNFDEAWRDREEIEIEGIPVHVISKLHLAKNKEATGRPQYRVELAWLRGDDKSE